MQIPVCAARYTLWCCTLNGFYVHRSIITSPVDRVHIFFVYLTKYTLRGGGGSTLNCFYFQEFITTIPEPIEYINSCLCD